MRECDNNSVITYYDSCHDVLHLKPYSLFYIMWTQNKFYLLTTRTVLSLNWLR